MLPRCVSLLIPRVFLWAPSMGTCLVEEDLKSVPLFTTLDSHQPDPYQPDPHCTQTGTLTQPLHGSTFPKGFLKRGQRGPQTGLQPQGYYPEQALRTHIFRI